MYHHGRYHDLESESRAKEPEHLGDFLPDADQVIDHDGIFRIAHRYIDGLVTLHLHLRVRPARNDASTEEFCAVVAGGLGYREDGLDLSYVSNDARPPRRFLPLEIVRREVFRLHRNRASDVEHSMLVRVVQPSETCESVQVSYLGSKLVGLHALNECPIVSAYAANHPAGFQAIPLPAFVDGELCIPGGLSAAKEHELPKEIVQRGPQVVAELGHDQSDTGIGWWSAETENILAHIAIEVTDDAAVFIVQEDAPFAVECGQVLVRPL
jgi:hypothetical protein